MLRDHEQGHVNIAARIGKGIVGDGIERGLEALPALTRSAADQVIRQNAASFEFWEGILSWGYDKLDYPRMEEAYRGARMSLDEVIDISPRVGDLAKTLRAFSSGSSVPSNVDRAVRRVITAREALDWVDLARVQYNEDFEELVFAADETIAELQQEYASGSPTDQLLRRLLDVLGAFTWQAPAE